MRISDWSSDVCSSDLRAARWEQAAATVRKGLDDGGWDGQWYRRGYYDDGTPLGSHESDECRIDTIAQSWSVIAGGGDPAHAESAMEQVDRQLILPAEKVALRFTPPFPPTSSAERRVGKAGVRPGR